MKITENIFLFKNFLIRKSAISKYKRFLQNDILSKKELNQLNWDKRKKLVEFAYYNIPFYKKFYEANNFNPDLLKSEKDWEKVPVITKVMIRESFSDLINTKINKNRYYLSATGGTSGKPLKVLHDKNNFQEVNSWRLMKWWNLPLAPNIAFVYRLFRHSGFKVFLNDLIWFPTKRIFLDATNVDEEKILKFLNQLTSNNVLVVQGYTGALNEVAHYILSNNIKIKKVSAIWCTSSPLTETIRQNLEKAFGGEVFDQYGSGEIYWIATECKEHSGLHIHSDMRHLDIVDDNGKILENGTLGNVVVTDLENHLFPIIRYQNGDLSLVKKEKCNCGMPYPLLEKIYGRVTDLIRLPNGGFIAGDYFTTIFDDYPEDIDSFQVHQKEDYSLEIKYKVSEHKNFNKSIIDKIESTIKLKTEGKIELRIMKVDDVMNNLAGKNRFVISDIK